MKTAQRWNVREHQYEPCDVPENASLYESNMEKQVACANCGEYLKYGECFTSLEIHSSSGMGYAVCGKCYDKERFRAVKGCEE